MFSFTSQICYFSIDSFPSNASLAMVGAYRLIQQCVEDNLEHLKRTRPDMYALAQQTVPFDGVSVQLSSSSSKSDRMLAFSKLVAQAYGLLQWFETEEAALFYNWPDKKAQQKSLNLQETLKQILEENSRPSGPDDGDKQRRPSNRIVSAFDPEARIAMKGKSTKIMGYKVQNLCTTAGVI